MLAAGMVKPQRSELRIEQGGGGLDQPRAECCEAVSLATPVHQRRLVHRAGTSTEAGDGPVIGSDGSYAAQS